MPNLKHLYYFRIFAEDLSLTKASKRLGITPPALSNQLKQLEEFLGSHLTRRVGGKVHMTEYGEMILHYALRMFSAYDDLKAKIVDTENWNRTHFRVGICHNIGARFAFDLISMLEKVNRGDPSNTHYTFGSADELMADFVLDRFEIMVGAPTDESSAEKTTLVQRLSFPVRLFAPIGIPSSPDLPETIRLAESQKIALVLPTKPGLLRLEIDSFLRKNNIDPPRIIECNTSSGIVELIERGYAMGFVPTPCLLDFRAAQLVSVTGPPEGFWAHQISVFIQKTQQTPTSKTQSL